MKKYSFPKQPQKRKNRWCPVPWKPRNLRKIPRDVIARTDEILSVDIVVAAVIKIPESTIRDGHYDHLGISWEMGRCIVQKIRLFPRPKWVNTPTATSMDTPSFLEIAR